MNNINTVNGINYLINPNKNNSYANSVLQSLYSLFCIRDYFTNPQNVNNFMNFQMPLSKSFHFLLKTLMNGSVGDSSNTIDNYNVTAKENAFKTDPYHFLFYFLEQLHWENNKPSNQYYNYSQLENVDINLRINDNYMYSLFCSFFQSTQNSIISQKFYNIIKIKKHCNQCNSIFYKYNIRKALVFDIDNYFKYRNEAIPAKANNPKIDLDECFQCYIGGISVPCPRCNSNMNTALEYRNIWSASEILIIYFSRIYHKFLGDVDFRSRISISNYFSNDNINNNNNRINTTYSLKACISYARIDEANKIYKYFADCFMPINNNMGGVWMRYMDGQKIMLEDVETEIHKYEPVILIYELDNFRNNNNMSFMNSILQQMMVQQQFKQYIEFFNKFKSMQQIQIQIMDSKKNNFNDMYLNNFNNNNIVKYNPMSQNTSNDIFFQLKFICVPETGDQSEKPTNTIKVQIRKDDTIKKAILNFFMKLGQEEDSIQYFIFNGTRLDKNSNATLEIGRAHV